MALCFDEDRECFNKSDRKTIGTNPGDEVDLYQRLKCISENNLLKTEEKKNVGRRNTKYSKLLPVATPPNAECKIEYLEIVDKFDFLTYQTTHTDEAGKIDQNKAMKLVKKNQPLSKKASKGDCDVGSKKTRKIKSSQKVQNFR